MSEHDDLDAALAEFLELLRRGRAPEPEVFAEAHPALRGDLLALLPGIIAIEGLKYPSSPAAPPARLGEFELRRELGRGAMGAVYEAWQPSLGRTVALKRLAPAWAGDARSRERFTAEARTLARLHHTHIVEIYGAGTEGDELYFVMELIEGRSLDRVAPAELGAPGAARERCVAELGRQAAEALAYAHERGVLHRDIKPANLLLDAQGLLHVGDFGLAAAAEGGAAAAHSQPDAGTLRYLAPERLLGRPASASSDQYALGLSLHELLRGLPVFVAPSVAELIRRIGDEPVPSAPCSPDLAAILAKSTAREPADRYADLAAFAADLRRFLDGRPVVARPPSAWRTLRLWARRKPVPAALGLLSLSLGVACLVILAVGYRRVSEALRREDGERRRAEANAAVAQAALDRIFAHFDRLPDGFAFASPQSARLLDELLPSYAEIGASAATPPRRLAEVTLILARLQSRAGRPREALESFERSLALYAALPDAAPQLARARLHLAATLDRLDRRPEAEALRREVAAQAGTPGCALPAVEALLDCVDSSRQVSGARAARGAPELARAADLLTPLLRADKPGVEARFLLCRLLAADAGAAARFEAAGLPHDPVLLLEDLVREQPRDPRHRLALSRQLAKVRSRGAPDEAAPARLRRACEEADRLLADFPGEGAAISNAVEIRLKESVALQRAGRTDEAAASLQRAEVILGLLNRSGEGAERRQSELSRKLDEARESLSR